MWFLKFLLPLCCQYYLFFKISSYSKLQLQNFHENSPCFNFKSHFICLKHSKKTFGYVIYDFSLIECSPNYFNFFVNFNIFHKKGSMSSKHSKSKNTRIILNFNTRMSFYIIHVLNLYSWFKVKL
jgi:hypothetical protein